MNEETQAGRIVAVGLFFLVMYAILFVITLFGYPVWILTGVIPMGLGGMMGAYLATLPDVKRSRR